MSTIKAIETQYKGYRFRSRLEARWAVFFDHIGWEWEYEPEGFDLGYGVMYLPDFRIGGDYVEVKAFFPTLDEKRKAYLLSLKSEKAVVFAVGMPDPKNLGLPGYYVSDGEQFDEAFHEDVLHFGAYCCQKWGRPGVYMGDLADWFGDDIDTRACNAARSARFEFGESGARA